MAQRPQRLFVVMCRRRSTRQSGSRRVQTKHAGISHLYSYACVHNKGTPVHNRWHQEVLSEPFQALPSGEELRGTPFTSTY